MKLTQINRKEIVAAILAEKTTKELATKYGVTSTRIGEVYREETGKGVIKIGKLSQNDKEAIVAELQAKKATIQELARRYDVSSHTISRNFKDIVGKAFLPRPLLQIDQETFVQELQSGKVMMKDLAIKYGVHQDTISRKFKQITGTSLHPRKLSQADRKNIVAELQSGKTPAELSATYGVVRDHLQITPSSTPAV